MQNVRKKWKDLRDTYGRALKKSQQDGKLSPQQTELLDVLSFLKYYMRTKTTNEKKLDDLEDGNSLSENETETETEFQPQQKKKVNQKAPIAPSNVSTEAPITNKTFSSLVPYEDSEEEEDEDEGEDVQKQYSSKKANLSTKNKLNLQQEADDIQTLQDRISKTSKSILDTPVTLNLDNNHLEKENQVRLCYLNLSMNIRLL